MARLSEGEADAWTEADEIPTAEAIVSAVDSVSPVTIDVEIPMRCSAATDATAVVFRLSNREIVPAYRLSIATWIRVMPEAVLSLGAAADPAFS